MKSQFDDGSFGQVLQEHWHVHPRRNPDFRTAVWARIDSARQTPSTWGAWLRLNMLRFASVAVACVTIAGVGGAWLAHEQADHAREQLVKRYLASIDPHVRVDLASR